MNVGGIILVVCLYPFLFIMYFLLKNEGEPKKNMRYGVTLTKEQQKDADVLQIGKEYHKQMRSSLAVLAIVPIPMLFIPWFSILMCAWLIWMLAMTVAFFIPLGVANRKLKQLKIEKGWKQQVAQVTYTEIKAASSIRQVKWYQFLPPCAISVAIFVWTLLGWQEESTRILMVMFGALSCISFFFWVAAVWTDKQKTQVISTDSDININYARAKKKQWRNFWIANTWMYVVYIAGMLLSVGTSGKLKESFWVINIIYIVLTVLLCWWLLKKKEALDKSYQDKKDILPIEEDDYWIGGMIYYNPKDKHTMVEKRTGIGTTTNMATPAGKGVAGFLGLSILCIPLLMIWMIRLEFTPIQLEIKDNYVIANHLKEEHSIAMISIKEVELLSKLPDMSRNHGTSMDTLRKGSYKVDGEEESCSVFLNPQNTIFLRIRTSDRVYFLSGYEDTQTREIYELIK